MSGDERGETDHSSYQGGRTSERVRKKNKDPSSFLLQNVGITLL